MKVKATEKFQELGIENCYQRLETEIYYALRRGEIVEIDKIPVHLITGEYIEKIKSVLPVREERTQTGKTEKKGSK